MKISIIGSGAMGCLFGYYLVKAKAEVTLIDTWQEHIEVIQNHGLTIVDGHHTNRVHIKAFSDAYQQTEKMDLIIIFVKAYDTRNALEKSLHLIGENTRIMTLQNGVGNIEVISEFISKEKIIGGTTAHGAMLKEKGVVVHAGKGKTRIGRIEGENGKREETICAFLNEAKIDTDIEKNIDGLIWDKLLVNVGINGLTAILDIENGKLLEREETETLMKKLVMEAIRVAEEAKIQISYPDPLHHVKAVAKATGNNRSSMLQDLSRGKKTEIEYINGAIVKKGKELGIPTPYNDFLQQLVRAKEKLS
ncbi:ketopantoate reductase [Tindallia magadiensis]|uniref:2-dehydropantoate 2-reductase n=1 Tax=Tindallia magadiensis TaxID=69895 RepID=A0A1I3DZC1_9FIRM|nr:2-dehydropantoate 2-reductase [Tindallia magadiensis]SFH92084.1 ketopantoate reductase [Tindallia magadiensis]